jgi:hypothetical protein
MARRGPCADRGDCAGCANKLPRADPPRTFSYWSRDQGIVDTGDFLEPCASCATFCPRCGHCCCDFSLDRLGRPRIYPMPIFVRKRA